MKTFLSLLILVAAATLHAQTIQTLMFPLVGQGADRTQSVSIATGDVFEALTWAAPLSGSQPPTLKVDGITVANGYYQVNPTLPKIVVAGPATVSVVVPSDIGLVFSYKVTSNSAVATANVASSAVVIPANASAPVDVILESSVDLITWNAALPGSYAPSTEKRFFRVRTVLH